GPTASFLGDFGGAGRLGLATLDGGGGVTVFDNPMGKDPGVAVSSGGLAPVAGVAEGVNGDGFSDLLGGPQDRGTTLRLGGAAGLSLAGALTPQAVDPQPTSSGGGPPSPPPLPPQDEQPPEDGGPSAAPTPQPEPEPVVPADSNKPPSPRVTVFRLNLEPLTRTAAGVVPVLHAAGDGAHPAPGAPPAAAGAPPPPP